MNAGGPGPAGMHQPQRPPQPGGVFQNVGNMRGGNPMQSTPPGKRPQDARGPLASGQQKKYIISLIY